MFILAKLVNILLNPALWVLVVLLRAALTHNPYIRRRWTMAGLAVFLIFTSPLVIHRIIKWQQWKPVPMAKGEQYAAGVLLGGVMTYDENNREAYFMGAQDRFIQTLKLYKEGHIRKIIVSGGNAVFATGSYREGDWLAKNLASMGVPPADIINERRAMNTVENARYSHQLMDSAQVSGPIVIVTSSWHMSRAVRIFEKEGLKVRPFPCDYLIVPYQRSFQWTYLLPSGDALEHWNLILKEWVGILAIDLQRALHT